MTLTDKKQQFIRAQFFEGTLEPGDTIIKTTWDDTWMIRYGATRRTSYIMIKDRTKKFSATLERGTKITYDPNWVAPE